MKDKKREEIKKHADVILSELSTKNPLILEVFDKKNPFKSKHGSIIYDVIDYLKSKGYIQFYQGYESNQMDDNGNWIQQGEYIEKITITELGIDIKEKGGIVKSEKRIKKDACLNRWGKIVGIIGGVVGLIGGSISIYKFIVVDKKQQRQTEVMIDSLNIENRVLIENLQKEIDNFKK